jgi:hypothetical protein
MPYEFGKLAALTVSESADSVYHSLDNVNQLPNDGCIMSQIGFWAFPHVLGLTARGGKTYGTASSPQPAFYPLYIAIIRSNFPSAC